MMPFVESKNMDKNISANISHSSWDTSEKKFYDINPWREMNISKIAGMHFHNLIDIRSLKAKYQLVALIVQMSKGSIPR